MSSKGKTYTIKDFIVGYDELNQTSLYAVYQAYFNSECDTFNGAYAYCTPDENYAPLSNRLIDLYKKFVRNLELISDVKEKALDRLEKSQDKLCLYLKYWFYDNLISESVTEAEFKNFLSLWNEQKSKKCKDCNCHFEINTISAIKELKSMYDYFLFTDAYKKISKINNEISKKIYCEYIYSAKVNYALIKDTCAQKSNPYCRELKKYIEKYLVVDEDSSIICNNEENTDTYTQTAKHLDQKLSIGPLSETFKGDKDEGADGESEVDGYRSFGLPNLPNQHSSHGDLPKLPDDAVTQDLPQGPTEDNTHGVSDNSITDSADESKSTGTIISASSVGTVGFLFLLYKFTPLRSMLDPRIRNTKKNLINGVQGSNELQSQNFDFDPTDMDFNRYSIGYQSR
ncbi:Plasmodium vivax Vir protein, putative [Plasmodium vivax]|uniref:Vir protein, putative n=1 Tax=Plasmodium vivax TaxID=5855 RepID=A0A1G4E6K0_PLAVI|nr:Plasmodium vivax Vir protein, putative [Plasmodium vivax]